MHTAIRCPVAQALLPEIDYELGLTRRLLERLPEDRLGWQPHPKSMTLAHLAGHTANLLGGIDSTLRTTELDLATYGSLQPGPATSRAEVLERLATNGAAARTALTSAAPESLTETWTLRHGEQVILRHSRAEIVRHLISHLIHHRGQLSVYLRLLEVPVPYLYGPSADEATPS
ncbi:DinB family protein [Hymenobacter elongatus]|uniref:DinB family protein n=1 Tax=Hymenobacter elongatus TaxID=877208 RepID=A0A4Z0PNY4_9BACT|nr:DinB family protein [Hymenobacter elongatus]TGE18971.1 DinB family protein [Hymenobacter elongatus]